MNLMDYASISDPRGRLESLLHFDACSGDMKSTDFYGSDNPRATPGYGTWKSMRQRCDPNGTGKPGDYYRKRSLKVCDRWNNSFLAFLEDVGPKPAPGYHLHRVVNEKGYEPGNCIWLRASEHVRLHAMHRRAEGGQKA
jgi:hypothetical protein